MMKLKVLTSLKLNPSHIPDSNGQDGAGTMFRRVKTVEHVPKMFSIVGNSKNGDFMPVSRLYEDRAGGIQVIVEEEHSRLGDSSSDNSLSEDDSGDEGSSIDGDLEKDE